jgi:hypothetical protein
LSFILEELDTPFDKRLCRSHAIQKAAERADCITAMSAGGPDILIHILRVFLQLTPGQYLEEDNDFPS